MIGFCQSVNARHDTEIRPLCHIAAFLFACCVDATWNPFNECFSFTDVSCVPYKFVTSVW